MNWKLLFISPIFIITGVQAEVVKKVQFCEGEHESSCAVKPVYGCPVDTKVGAGDRAKQICTVHTSDGPKVLEYMIEIKSNVEGNKCGYTVIEVTCLK